MLAIMPLVACMAQEPVPMTEQLAAYAHSEMRTVISTPSGRWMLAAEGGAITFIDTFDESLGTYVDTEFHKPDGTLKVQPSKLGVLPSRMVLDEDCQDPPVGGPKDLLHVAAGRDGYWVFQLHHSDPTLNRAFRIDDSGNTTNVNTQNSRRYCCDLDFATVGGEKYVLALFTRKGKSRLRGYRLADVHAQVAGATTELGTSELLPQFQVDLDQHPTIKAMPPEVMLYAGKTYLRSVALSMDVHQVGDDVDVYVAMGPHGIARARIVESSGTISNTVEWGPFFGVNSPASLSGVPDAQVLYGNWYGESILSYHEEPKIEREERPIFTDVEIFDGDIGGQNELLMFASVDHLFWVVFDLQAGFDENLPILHQGGVSKVFRPDHAFIDKAGFRPELLQQGDLGWKPGGEVFGCGAAIRSYKPQSADPILVVSTGQSCFLKDYMTAENEGVVFDADFAFGGGEWSLPSAAGTWVYQLSRDPGGDLLFETESYVEGGGSALAVPGDQELLPDKLKVMHGYKLGQASQGLHYKNIGCSMTLFPLRGSTRTELTFERNHRGYTGSYAWGAAFLPDQDGRVLRSHNDGGLASPGTHFVVQDQSTGEWSITADYYQPTDGAPVSDYTLPLGLVFEEDAVYRPDPVGQPEEFVVCSQGSGPVLPGLGVTTVSLPAQPWDNGAGPPPVQGAKRNFDLSTLQDRFGGVGRPYYVTTAMSEEFDSYAQSLGAVNQLLFVTKQKTSEGLYFVDRADTLAVGTGNNHPLPLLDPNHRLNTHPEFNGMPAVGAPRFMWQELPAVNGEKFQDRTQVIMNWAPKFIPVKADENDPGFSSWVLAVPCGSQHADPDWDVFENSAMGGDPAWLPDGPLAGSYGHGFVQFYGFRVDEVDEEDWIVPDAVTAVGVDGSDIPGVSTLPILVAPDGPSTGSHRGMIWRLEHFQAGDHVFLVSVDFTGRVYIHTIEDILTLAGQGGALDPSYLVASWTAEEAGLSAESLFDDLPSNTFDVAVDYRGGDTAMLYVSIKRVGIQLLSFDVSSYQLTEAGKIQTSSANAAHMSIREIPGESGGPPQRQMVLTDYEGGLRLFGEE